MNAMHAIDTYEPSVLTPDQDRRTDLGGKAHNLMFLLERGYRVPAFVVVPSTVFDGFLEPLRPRVDDILGNTDGTKPDTIASASKHISDILASARTQTGSLTHLKAAMHQHTTAGRTYAVRSSVLGEDSSEHSFAGLMQSFLCVRAEDVPDAIVRVWGSAFSAGALLYRHRKSIPLTDIHAAVIVQEMVPSVSSGVLFTRDPETGEQSMVISAAFGLGEGVVGNLVDTDTFTLDWDGALCSSQVSRKQTKIDPANGPESGTAIQRVSEEDQRSWTLSAEQLKALVSLGKKLERDTGSPQDVEWAYDGEGTLWILQTRPIVRRSGETTDVRIWDNSNIVESYPGLTLPLTFSFVLDAYACLFRRAAEGFFPFRRLPTPAGPVFDSMIGLREGRVYYNLLNWYEMLSYLPGFQAHKKAWDQMIGINTQLRVDQKQLPWYTRWTSALIAAFRLMTVDRNARSFNRSFTRFYAPLAERDVQSLSGIEIAGLFTAIRSELNGFWYRTLFNDFAAMKYYDWLKQLCGAVMGHEASSVHNDLLCGEKGIESVRPVRSLVAIAEYISADPELLNVFEDTDDRRIWDRIQRDRRSSGLRTRLAEHLRLFGDRGIEELKLERPSFRDDPSIFITLVRSYIQEGLTVRDQEDSEQQIRTKAQRLVFRSKGNPFTKALLRVVLRRARHAIAQRENMRFARTRTFALMRRLFRRLGDLFANAGLIGNRDDIFYLTVSESLDVVRGTSTTADLRQLVRMRKQEYEAFARRTPEERFMTTGIPGLHQTTERASVRPTCDRLVGTPCSSGRVEGEALVVLDPTEAKGRTGKILVARSTDPGWVFLMIVSKGIIVEKGSVLSHTAIIGRELGIPTVVGVKHATSAIPDKAHVHLDGERGVITWH